ncbi:MAG: TlpA disulfide reductase family protein [Candidatus Cloacimonetes bacterium]|nr:TlpA disulfide reductase family protein [Candidatus Cloacimonadota bacterium]
MKKYLILILLLVAISAIFAEAFPEFKLPDMNNRQVSKADLVGKGIVLIDFWATWCQPCKISMPYLHSLAEKYDSLTVVMVSIDAAKDISKARNYIKSKNFKFTGLFDSEKSLAKRLNVSNPPHTFILDREGNVIYSHVGFSAGQEKEYEGVIRKALGLDQIDTGEVSDCE